MKTSMVVLLLLLALPSAAQECTYTVTAIVRDVDMVNTEPLQFRPRRVTLGVGLGETAALLTAKEAMREGVQERLTAGQITLYPPSAILMLRLYQDPGCAMEGVR